MVLTAKRNLNRILAGAALVTICAALPLYLNYGWPELSSPLNSITGSTVQDMEQAKIITIDASDSNRHFRDIYGVNAGPNDAAAAYQEAGVQYVRLHDAGGHNDYHEYTSFYDAENDRFNQSFAPSSAGSYDWTAVDRDLSAIINNGMQPFFRLGISWPREGIPVKPPLDPDGKGFTRFAELCRRTLMHYNQGWDNGYDYGIKYWEVWNEPDGRFWKGSSDQFFTMYKAVAGSIKAQDPSIKVGGPGTTPGAAVGKRTEYLQDFLKYCQAEKAPLDFYSWHLYSVFNPYMVKGYAEYVRSAMDEAGLQDAESIISEINLALGKSGDKDLDSAKGAAYVASVMLTAQDAPIDMLLWYRGNKFMNLFANDVDGEAEYKWNGLGYRAVQTMISNAPERLETTGNEISTIENGKSSTNFMVAAGRSEDQKDVYIVISNYYSRNEDIVVQIKGMTSGAKYEATRFLIQQPDDKWTESSETLVAGDSTLEVRIADFNDPAVCMLRVHRL